MLADVGSGWGGSMVLYAGITGMYQYIALVCNKIEATVVQYSISYRTLPFRSLCCLSYRERLLLHFEQGS